MKKKVTVFLVIAMAMFVLVSGCKKDDDTPSATSAINFSIDGSEWAASTATAKNVNNILTVSGISADGSHLTITIYNGFKVGTYELNKYSFGVAVYQNNSGEEGFTTNATSEAGGQVEITEIDSENKTISGSFQFELIGQSSGDKVVITSGVIDKLSYTLNK